jgi:hypothetical protein
VKRVRPAAKHIGAKWVGAGRDRDAGLPLTPCASLNPPSVWQFYPTLEAAAAKADIVNGYTQRLDARLGTPARQYEPMTFEAYKQVERQFYLSDPLQEISEEKFTEMFEVLPPKHVRTRNDVFSFLMIEHFSGPYTSQYASYGSKHYTRLVDATDESTWITPEEIKRFQSAKECGPGEYPPGTEIYYTGDVANQPGFGVITTLNRDPQWGDTYDFTLEDGREIKGIATHSLGDKYEGHGGTRFVTREAYDAFRQEKLEAYRVRDDRAAGR